MARTSRSKKLNALRGAQPPRSFPRTPKLSITFDPNIITKLVSWLAKNTPARTTIRQIYAFIMIADADTNGKPITLTQIRALAGDDVFGEEVFKNSIARSYQLFLTPELSDDEMALSWIQQLPDPTDKRAKYLKMTALGKTKYEELSAILNQ